MLKFFDDFSDEELLKWLDLNYGQDEPIWEECSKEEYEENFPKKLEYIKKFMKGDGEIPSLEDLEEWMQTQYKREPVYKEWKGGILNLIKLQEEKEPDYYKYYKQIGTKRIILVGSQIIDYLNKRGINYGSN